MLSPWLQRWGQSTHARVRLFCFPHAGGAAVAFRLWPQGLPADVDVVAVQLPGRGTRWKEPAIDSIPGIVEALVPAMKPQMDVPFALFGHSMGSIVARALADELVQRGGPLPFHLFASSRRPPRMAGSESLLHPLSDSAFVDEMMRRYGGIPAEVLAEPELVALLLPALRADMRALETYRPEGGAPLPFPVTAYGGTEDSLNPREHIEAWRGETRSAFRARMFQGGHFYLEGRRAELLGDVGEALLAAPDAGAAQETGT
jgi:surfactin synthase thioesterase subunit